MKKLSLWIAIAILGGGILGLCAPELARSLGFLGKIFIQMITMVAGPFLFTVIVHAIVAHAVPAKQIAKLLVVALINAGLAMVIGLGLVNALESGRSLPYAVSSNENVSKESVAAVAPPKAAPLGTKISLESFLRSLIPENVVQPFASQNMLALVFLAIIVGAALRARRSHTTALVQVNEAAQYCFENILLWFSSLVPIAVFSAMASTLANHGLEALQGLLYYALTVVAALALHVVLTYHAWIFFYCRLSLRDFWKRALRPAVYSFGVNSSLATLPLTLEALKELKVSEEASTLGACIGTNLNNDGIVLYQVAAALMVAQSLGIHLSLSEQVLLAGVSLLASIGMAGIPEAGFILLTVVLTTMGLPPEGIPILLTVDWLLGRARSVVNVLNDMVISMVIDPSTRSRRAKSSL